MMVRVYVIVMLVGSDYGSLLSGSYESWRNIAEKDNGKGRKKGQTWKENCRKVTITSMILSSNVSYLALKVRSREQKRASGFSSGPG
jgi:hypothetical protein